MVHYYSRYIYILYFLYCLCLDLELRYCQPHEISTDLFLFFSYFVEEIFRSKNYFSLINPEEFSRHETFYFGSLNCKFNFYSLWRAANAVYFTASLDYLCFLQGWFILSNLLAHSCLQYFFILKSMSMKARMLLQLFLILTVSFLHQQSIHLSLVISRYRFSDFVHFLGTLFYFD